MYIAFEELSDNSRVWIYQASKPFPESEKVNMEIQLRSFCEQWAAHGHPLKTSFKIEYNQFIILAADESYHLPSGCSIDSSVHVIKALESQTGISFFDRSLIAFQMGNEVRLFPMNKLKEEFINGTLTSETLAFNNLVANKEEWQKGWLVPVKQGWLARYIPQYVAVS